jgi:hypothetical protein
MTESEFREMLSEALRGESDYWPQEVEYVTSFEDSGVLTSNEGLVVRLDDGSEFQVTVVRSR